jgi:hypothetical protein
MGNLDLLVESVSVVGNFVGFELGPLLSIEDFLSKPSGFMNEVVLDIRIYPSAILEFCGD